MMSSQQDMLVRTGSTVVLYTIIGCLTVCLAVIMVGGGVPSPSTQSLSSVLSACQRQIFSTFNRCQRGGNCRNFVLCDL